MISLLSGYLMFGLLEFARLYTTHKKPALPRYIKQIRTNLPKTDTLEVMPVVTPTFDKAETHSKVRACKPNSPSLMLKSNRLAHKAMI